MMTIHSAKGLEFPYVFINGMEDNIFPGVQSMFSQSELEEERRLAYVAITRAKKQLYITNAQTRMLYGSTQRNVPSMFLREIPKSLIDCEDAAKTAMSVSQTIVHKPTSSYTPSFARGVGTHTAPKAPAASYKSGQIVSHKTFGRGMIITVTKMGNDNLLEIAFENAGTKKLMSNFARLEIIE